MSGPGDHSACLEPDAVMALLHGRLERHSLHAAEQHIASCSRCREVLSAMAHIAASSTVAVASEPAASGDAADSVASRLACGPHPVLAAGSRVGRYIVGALLGTGAMGAVYAAQDPELDRQIALKILRHGDLARGERDSLRDRLRAEAQAMAQLAHPNVVTVHDVGTIDDHIFLAMELVAGQTLAAWLAAERRGWRAVVAMFVSAGQGLAAAHRAGLVHRDFKPENVLVGSDGRVRVGDFGLATMLPAPGADHELLVSASLEISRTTTGTVAGTPYYMAPEQFCGQAADARSDQFSFCVALYAAIARAHPFDGDRGGQAEPRREPQGIEGLAAAVTSGRLRKPPGRRVLPRWLLGVLRRGLSLSPDDRFPSMDALLARLRHDPGRRRAQVAVVAVAAVALIGGGVVLARGSDPGLLCTGAEQAWAGAWDAARAGAVERAFLATGTPYADAAYRSVAHALGAYRESWTAMHTAACQATRVRGEQSEELLERRMLCLDARRRDVRALVDRFAAADGSTVERAASAAGSLGELASCADPQALSSQVRPPGDLVTRTRVAGFRSELAELKALRVAGRARDGRKRIAALAEATRALHYRPLEAEALREQGEIEVAAGDLAVAARAYEQAVWAAEVARADELAASAWIRFMRVRRAQARYDDALALAPRVTAALERLGGNDDLEGELDIVRAGILTDASRFAEAKPEAEKARTVLERRFGSDDLRVAEAYQALAEIAGLTSHLDDAIAYFQRTLAIKRRVLGDAHPAVAAVIYNLGNTDIARGRYQDALSALDQAQAIFVRAVDPTHVALAHVARARAEAYAGLGRLDEAVASYRRGLAIAAVAFGPEHPTHAVFLMDLGEALRALGRYDEAHAALQQALPVLEKRLGPAHARLAICLVYLARVQSAKGQLQSARTTIARAVTMYEQVVGPDSPNLRESLLVQGTIELELGAPSRALPPLERAVALGPAPDPVGRALIEAALGRALVETRRDLARGMALVRAAQNVLAASPQSSAELRELVRWRRRHP